MQSIRKKFIGDKEFFKLALYVAIPLMLQQLITSSVNLVDNLMVGQLGDAALGGVAAVNRFYMIANYGIMGVASASAIFIAQYFGANDENHMKQSFRTNLIFSYGIATIFFLLGLLVPQVIVTFFIKDPEIVNMGLEYIKIAAWTFLPLAMSIPITSAMRAVGNTKTPLMVSVIAVLTNTVLNYCLIFGNFGMPALGVTGAAIATLIARCLEMSILLYLLFKGDFPFKTNFLKVFHISKKLVKAIVLKAAPLALNEVLWAGGMATLFKFYATRGSEVMSGYSIASTTSDLFFVLFGGMAAASTVLISQPLGANKLEKAKDNAYKLIGFSLMLSIVFALLMFGSSFIIPHFYNVSATANHVAVQTLRVMSVFFWIYMANTICYFILRAGGDTKSTLFMDSVYMWGFNIPLVGLLTYLTKLPIIELYIIGQLTDIVKLFIAYSLVKREKWVKNLTLNKTEIIVD